MGLPNTSAPGEVDSATSRSQLASPTRLAARRASPSTLALLLSGGLLAVSCSAGGPGESSVLGEAEPGQGGSTPQTVSGLLATDEGELFESDDLEDPDDDCNGVLPVIYRDFNESHPDFEMAFAGDVVRRQLVAAELGPNRKPVFASSIGCPAKQGTPLECDNWTPSEPVITSAATFEQWYQTIDGVNVGIVGMLELEETGPGTGRYVYNSHQFFPIGTDQGFGATPAFQDKNFLFTSEIHLNFIYYAGQRFSFRGDDDLWIFVNGRLAMDLGSMHGAETGTIDFDAQASQLGIVPGRSYPMDIFHAERHTTGSNFGFETNIACFTPSILR